MFRFIIPPFLQYFIDAVQGDFNANPRARAATWPSLFVGLLSMTFAGLAGFFGYPLYLELISSLDLATYAISRLLAYIVVFIVSGSIFTLSQHAAMYIAEKKDFAASRIQSGKFSRIIIFLVIVMLLDAGMNYGGQRLRLNTQRADTTEEKAGRQFVFARQVELDAVTNDIYRLQHPKEIGCAGDLACRKTCPVSPLGAVHASTGTLTRFGKPMLAELNEKKLALETERKADKDLFFTSVSAGLHSADVRSTSREAVSYTWIAFLYILMIFGSVLSAGFVLDFEEAAGILPDYDHLCEEEQHRVERLKDRRERAKDMRIHAASLRVQKKEVAASARRDQRRQTMRHTNNPKIEPIPYPHRSSNGNGNGIRNMYPGNGEDQAGNAALSIVPETVVETVTVPIGYETVKRSKNGGNPMNGNRGRENGETVTVETVANGYKITCRNCGKKTVKRSPRARFCSDRCRLENHRAG